MAEIQHSQIKAKLLEIVTPLIDQTDIVGKVGTDKEAHVLSRAIAAAALKILAEIEYDAACAAIVDGGKTPTDWRKRSFYWNIRLHEGHDC